MGKLSGKPVAPLYLKSSMVDIRVTGKAKLFEFKQVQYLALARKVAGLKFESCY